MQCEGGEMALSVNEYFDGSVKSIGFVGVRGKATVGVMNPGSYEFSTSTVEVMTVIDGALAVRLPSAASITVYRSGDSFEVSARETFHLTADVPTAYHCLYRP
jgi:uncharacterized protein YaiE (UPF0345 family)